MSKPRPNSMCSVPPARVSGLLERIVALYQREFKEVPVGSEWLQAQGLGSSELHVRHRIGFSSGRLMDILPTDGVLLSELKEVGILCSVKNNQYCERFRECVVVPIQDEHGKIVTIWGLRADRNRKGYKMVTIPQSLVGVWNIRIIKTYPSILVCDDILDGLSLDLVGFPNVVVAPGCADFQGRHDAVLRKHGVKDVFVLPKDCHPNAILREYGEDKLVEIINSMSAGRVSVAQCSHERPEDHAEEAQTEAQKPQQLTGTIVVLSGPRQYQVIGLDKRKQQLRATIKIEQDGRMHVDTLDLYNARLRQKFSQDLCRFLSEPIGRVEGDLAKIVRHCEDVKTDSVSVVPAEGVLVLGKDRSEAEEFGRDPNLIDRVVQDIGSCGLVGETINSLLCYLAMTSRKMTAPLSVLVLSASGSGKSMLQDTVLSLCPTEDLVKLTAVSGRALFYKKQQSLKHKVLALEEREGIGDADYPIRNLISAGRLVSETTVKDAATGQHTTVQNSVEGPTAVFVTTTSPNINPETKSRFFVTSIDESREQTRRILDYQRRSQTLSGLLGNVEIPITRLRHHNYQRLLRHLHVINPYAERLVYGDDRLQGRRDQPKYLRMVNAVAFLRQMQKEVSRIKASNGESIEYVTVDLSDIRIATDLARQVLGHSLDELSHPGLSLLMLLDAMVADARAHTAGQRAGETVFTRREVRSYTGWSDYRVHTHLRELVDMEYVLVENDRAGFRHRYRLAYDGQGKSGEKFLMGVRSIDDLAEK